MNAKLLLHSPSCEELKSECFFERPRSAAGTFAALMSQTILKWATFPRKEGSHETFSNPDRCFPSRSNRTFARCAGQRGTQRNIVAESQAVDRWRAIASAPATKRQQYIGSGR